jgi:hypothetical protein
MEKRISLVGATFLPSAPSPFPACHDTTHTYMARDRRRTIVPSAIVPPIVSCLNLVIETSFFPRLT